MYNHPKAKLEKNINIEVILPEEKLSIGKVSQIKIAVKGKENNFLQYAFFELTNERTDKRGMDRVTSRSRYLYRYNIEKTFESDAEDQLEFPIRVPVHKEPSRNDKFICIKWQLSTKIYMTKPEEEAEAKYIYSEATPIEIEVV